MSCSQQSGGGARRRRQSAQMQSYLADFDRAEAFRVLSGRIPGAMLATPEAVAYFQQYFHHRFDAARWSYAREAYMTEFLNNWTAAWNASFGYDNGPPAQNPNI
ncbi:hypothetical protein MMC10_008853 [Thelotrema lepadinum]|nr:hypothetical protein [Thelotrema lepadinum]